MADENVEPRHTPGLDSRLAAIRDATKELEDQPGPPSGGPATLSPTLAQIATKTRERERALSRRTFRQPFSRG